jgi:6-phosphogluconolactonase (cycloisomerase 2 family)
MLFGFRAGAQTTFAFVGSYTDGMPGQGIHVLRLDGPAQVLRPVWHGDGLVNASFLTLAPNGRTLYACTETKTPGDGRVRAFAVDSLTGALRSLNVRASEGENPVYVSVHPGGRWLVVANYTGSSITAYPLQQDGSIGEAAQHIAFTGPGSGVVADRQEGSHVHAAVFAPEGDRLYVPDLGCDRIRAFAFNADAPQPLRADAAFDVATAPGSGPRHLAFHPDGRTAYCIEELSGTLCVLQVVNGRLQQQQRMPSYAEMPAVGSSADVHVSPDGRYVYTSNRAPEHSIGIFAIDPTTGVLRTVVHESSVGNPPRTFAISPDGGYVLVANSASQNAVLFARDPVQGTLGYLGMVKQMEGAASVVWRTYATERH